MCQRPSIIYILCIAEPGYIREKLLGGRGQCYWFTGRSSHVINVLSVQPISLYVVQKENKNKTNSLSLC